MASNYSGQQVQPVKPKKRSKPSGLRLGGLSLDIDQINKDYDDKAEEKQRQN